MVFPAIFAIYKSYPVEPWERLLLCPPIYAIFAGHSAVMLFFVLSGYVLYLPYLQGRQPGYLAYVVKRWCRIYIPYFVAMVGAMLGATFLYSGPIPDLSPWLNASWIDSVTTQSIIDYSLLIGSTKEGDFNNVIWSLVHEMRISLLFPLIALMVTRLRWWQSLLIGIAVSLFGHFGPIYYWRLRPYIEYGLTAHYVLMFIIGAVLAKNAVPIQAWLARRSSWGKCLLFVVGMLFYLSDGYDPMFRIDRWVKYGEYLSSIGAAILIVLASQSRWLLAPSVVWLGRVSYSLYLWHVPVILATFHLGYGLLPNWVLAIISLIVGLVMAGVMYRLVERPSMALAKRLGRRRPIVGAVSPASLN